METGKRPSLISTRLAELQVAGRKAFIPFLMAGDPDLATTKKMIFALAEEGADLIELGIPFSDPLADGPVIQAAASRALARGVTLDEVLRLVKECRAEGLTLPVVFLIYYNLVYSRGEGFLAACQEAGVDGLVIPDLPLEERGKLAALAADTPGRRLDLILLATPTTPPERLKRIAQAACGFIYCVSTTGVTGVREGLPPELAAFLARLRALTTTPLAVGFGIGTPAQARAVAAMADGVIVGSALVRAAAEAAAAGQDATGAVRELARSLRVAI